MKIAAHVGHHIQGGPSAAPSPLAVVRAEPSTAGHKIGTGVASVRLGSSFMPAARALSADTKDAQDGETMAKGSTNVLVGADFKQMVRRGDPTTCGGEVAEGIATVFVGG